VDGGARLISAIASVIDANTPEEIDAILDTLPDPAGTFYRFGLAGSLMRRTHMVQSNSHRSADPMAEIPRLDPELAK
jgi:F420-non-reducing hydrogenase small subunit